MSNKDRILFDNKLSYKERLQEVAPRLIIIEVIMLICVLIAGFLPFTIIMIVFMIFTLL